METVRTFKCCGLKFIISENEISVEFVNEKMFKYINGREAVIAFAEGCENVIINILLPLIEEYGYNKYTGVKNEKNRRKIDTIRLRVLHTKCMTVAEIAKEMEISFDRAESALLEMGYAPIYTKDKPEPYKFAK